MLDDVVETIHDVVVVLCTRPPHISSPGNGFDVGRGLSDSEQTQLSRIHLENYVTLLLSILPI